MPVRFRAAASSDLTISIRLSLTMPAPFALTWFKAGGLRLAIILKFAFFGLAPAFGAAHG